MTNIIDNMLSLCPVSEDTIQELKKCMILCRFPKKYQLIKENTFCKSAYIELANWGRIIHQNEYRRLHRSHKERLTLPAKERYEEFKQQFPQICQRVKLRYIASYLGITLPTLSRLRAKK